MRQPHCLNGDVGGLLELERLAIIDQQNLFNPADSSFRQSTLRL